MTTAPPTNAKPGDDNYITMKILRRKLEDRARSSIYLDVKHGRLPPPMKLGGKLYWSERAVDTAMASLQAA